MKDHMAKYQDFLNSLNNSQGSNDGAGTEREEAERVIRKYLIFTGKIKEYCCDGFKSLRKKENYNFCPFCGKKIDKTKEDWKQMAKDAASHNEDMF